MSTQRDVQGEPWRHSPNPLFLFQGCLALEPWNKSLNFIFPTKYVIPKIQENYNTPIEHTPSKPPTQLWKESLYGLLVKV